MYVSEQEEQRADQGYYYCATPYSKYPGGIEAAFQLACREAANLIKQGVKVYSPIAHTHPIAIAGGMDPLDHSIWLPADEPFMRGAKGLIVLMADGWETSYGIAQEIAEFQKMGKPICFIDVGGVPALTGETIDVG